MIKVEKITELKEFYSDSELEILLTNKNIDEVFNDHVSQYSEEIEIYDLFKDDTYVNNGLLIDTPDGFQEVGDFYRKSPRSCYEINTENGHTLSGSLDHLIETQREGNWIKAGDLNINDEVITLDGLSKISSKQLLDEQEVFDFEVLHDNHRYWGGTGISSHNTGKTFLCLNAIKNAQDIGYAVFYIDTEGALDKKDFVNFGINMDLLNYKRIGIISEVKFFVYDIIQMKENNPDLKIMIIVDSLTHLETNKEVEDIAKGSNAQDMGLRAKELRQLFKSFTLDLSNLKVPLIFTSHTYSSMDKYNPKAMSGGSGPLYSASVVLMLSRGVLKGEDDVESNADPKEKTGVKVRSNTDKNRLAKPEKIEFHISFHKGMNPYVGLQDYLSWENCGVERGNKLTETEFSKLKGAESESCSMFEVNGETFYFLPKAAARNFIIKFNGDVVPWREIFSSRVFTDAVIDELDKNVIQPKFKYSSLADVEAAELIELQMEDDEDGA